MNSIPPRVTLSLDSLDEIYMERDCIVCHNRFLQRMKVNKQGKPVRVEGESDKFCSDECRREYNRAYHRKLRADNAEHFRQYNRKRMITQRNEQYKDQDIIDWLKSENAYLRGKIEVYEKFLKDRGFIKEE